MSATALASGTELRDASASAMEVNAAAGMLRLPLPSIASRRPESDSAWLVGSAVNERRGIHHRSWGGAHGHYSLAHNEETGGA